MAEPPLNLILQTSASESGSCPEGGKKERGEGPQPQWQRRDVLLAICTTGPWAVVRGDGGREGRGTGVDGEGDDVPARGAPEGAVRQHQVTSGLANCGVGMGLF